MQEGWLCNSNSAFEHGTKAAEEWEDDSTKKLMDAFKDGFARPLYAMKSPQREVAERYDKMG